MHLKFLENLIISQLKLKRFREIFNLLYLKKIEMKNILSIKKYDQLIIKIIEIKQKNPFK